VPVDRDRTLTLGECFRLYLPLGLTFLMISGAMPIVSVGLRWLGTQAEADHALAVYALAFRLTLLIHSPLFVCREIIITVSRDRASYRLAARFILAIAFASCLLDLYLALSPAGEWIFGKMTRDASLIPDARRALLIFAALPLLVAVRGVSQALLIVNDRTAWVGWSTALRLVVMSLLLMVLVPTVPYWGAALGAAAFCLGILCEAAMAHTCAWRERRGLPVESAPEGSERLGALLHFAAPLMIGNVIGRVAMPLFTGLAGQSSEAASSIAAYALVGTITITVGAPIFALQSLVTAKATTPANRRVLLHFAFLAALVGSLILTLLCLVPSVRDPILIHLWNAPPGSRVHTFALAIFPLTPLVPWVVAANSTLRAFLIRRRATLWTLLASTLGIGGSILVLRCVGLGADAANRADNAYAGWMLAMLLEALAVGAGYLVVRRPRT
jgi:Na+-driven multidrug efflux pump